MHSLDQSELALLRSQIGQETSRRPAVSPSPEHGEEPQGSNDADEGKGQRFLMALLRALSVSHA